MDESLFSLAGRHGLPAAIFEQGHAAAGPGVVTTKWKYFRMDPRAFMTMGILKARVCLLASVHTSAHTQLRHNKISRNTSQRCALRQCANSS